LDQETGTDPISTEPIFLLYLLGRRFSKKRKAP